MGSRSLGLSTAAMMYVSFVEQFPAGGLLLDDAYGTGTGPWVTALSFLREPTGALHGYFAFRAYWSGGRLGVIDAAMAGVVVFV
jgi:zinc transporter ZupT